MEDKKQKLLLIKLSSLGDVIFNLPLANALKEANYEVTWLVSEKGIQVVENNPCVDKTILVPLQKWRKRGFCLENIKEQFEIIKKLRAEKFDIAIDSQMMFKSLFWLAFCGAKRKISSKKAKEFSNLGANELADDISYNPKCPISLNYLGFAKYLGINCDKIKTALPMCSEDEVKKVDELLSQLDNTKPLVVIAPATTWENKHWNKDNWKKIVEYLENKCNLVFTGGPNDSKLIEYISENKYINLAGKTNIKELMEVFSRAKLVLAPDSGSAHLAWASANPNVITIFTCTPKEILAPYGNNEKYIALGADKLPCQPCFKRKCKCKDKNACTNYPTVEEVIAAIEKLL